ncbi:MAG: Lrp/AsnC family transcriptional regulator [Pseudomonadota bacterium]
MARSDLDEKDKILLQSLRRNSRASLVSLARDIDLSRSATHDRVTRLEELGVIRRYTIDIERSALPAVRAFFSVSFVSGQAQTRLAPQIHALDGVEAAYCLSGSIDMLVYCECETHEQLSVLRDALANMAEVSDIVTRPVLTTSQS